VEGTARLWSVRAPIDIERVRVSAERQAYERLRLDNGTKALPTFTPQNVAAARRELLTRTLLLSDTMVPEAYGAARAAMQTLGLDDRIELFQSPGAWDTARLALHGDPIGVEFIGSYLASLDCGGVLAVVGHEIGHAVAHYTTPHFAWVSSPANSTYPTRSAPSRRAYLMAAEMTADRFGLLACRDVEAVLRVEMLGAAGRAASTIHLDTTSYLNQCRAVAEDILANPGTMAVGGSHPEHYVRGYAEWLFSESDLYASITGSGPGALPIEDVDAMIARLLGLGPGSVRDRARPTGGFVTKPLPARPSTRGTLEELAADILTDGARRKVEATGKLFAKAANSVMPALQQLADAARARAGRSEKAVDEATGEEAASPPPGGRDLRAAFEGFVRKQRK
jgi:hypothetical protein